MIQKEFGSSELFDLEKNEASKTNYCGGSFIGLSFHEKSVLKNLGLNL